MGDLALSTKERRECFDRCKWIHPLTGRLMLTCHICAGPIDPARGTKKGSPDYWEAEHTTPKANGGTVTLPAHAACHRPKTSRDVHEIARGKRQSNKHYGIERSGETFRKAPEGYEYSWRRRRYVRAQEE
jgi:hypothetical protein